MDEGKSNSKCDNETIETISPSKIISGLRQQQKKAIKQLAQDRLKRLQASLKSLRGSREEKEQGVVKRSTSRSIHNNHNHSRSHSRTNSASSSNAISSSRTTADIFQKTRKPNGTSPCSESRQSCRSSIPTTRSLRFSEKSIIVSHNNSAWEKPKALIDASNRKARNSISANERLTRLRESLQFQRQLETNNNDHDMCGTSVKSEPVAAASIVVEPNLEVFNDNVESMDIDEPEVEDERKEGAAVPTTSNSCDSVVVPDPIVNHNQSYWDNSLEPKLHQVLATGGELPARIKDHMYFVLDTNVLMDNLTFVEELSRVAIGGTKGSMLYIPYIVIKELDKLKDKRNADELKHKAAVRAISYLNKKFDNSLKIQGQSALEEADHLIEVDCPDDSIVNCCLQLKLQVPHLMLLTNDNNLRLKANASAIQASRSSQLLSDYREKFDELPS